MSMGTLSRQFFGVSFFCMTAFGGTYDYSGNGRADLAVYDPAASVWYIHDRAAGQGVLWNYKWGPANTRIVAGDFNGDGRADLAKYDPATGSWYAHSILDGTLLWGEQWGFWRGRPVPADYNGDGITDLAVYHRERGLWYIRDGSSKDVLAWELNWGTPTMRPVPGDYNGDGAADLAVYDELTGRWYILTLQGELIGFDIPWGFQGAIPVPGDYNGDGKADLAVYQLTTGKWFIRTLDGQVLVWDEAWGFDGALPMPGDYNGDGRTDMAVYFPMRGAWYIRTVSGTLIAWGEYWGYNGAEALPRTSLAGHVTYREGPVTGPAPLSGEWVGDYYHRTVESVPRFGSYKPLFADVTHIRNRLKISTTLPTVGRLLEGSISRAGDLFMTDRYDDETWTTPLGPVQYNQIKVYDFLFRPVPGVTSILQVIDVVRY